MNSLKLPPHSTEAEMALLGSIIIEPESIQKVVNYVWQKDFFHTKHAKIYKALCSLWNETSKIDLINLIDRLDSYDDLATVGGESYLMELSSVVPTAFHIVKYAKILKEDSIRRQLCYCGSGLEKNAHNESMGVEDIFSNIENSLDKIHKDYEKSFKEHGMDYDKAVEAVLEKRCPASRGYNSGIDFLDEVTLGMKKRHYWLIYGASGVGKSYLGAGITHNLLKQNASVRFLSLEMSSEEIWDRIVNIEQNGDDKDNVAYDRMKDYKLIVEDNIRDIGEIGRYIKQYTYNTDVFFVDYLGMIKNRNIQGEIDNLIENSQELAHFAGQYNACIVCFGQTNNLSKQAADYEKVVRGGEQVAAPTDVLIRIKRKELEKEDAFGNKLYMELQLQKNRHGRGFISKDFPVNKDKGFLIFK